MSAAGEAATTGAASLRALVDDGRVHVLDGGMGTLLYSRGVFVNVCYDELNVSQPDLVKAAHVDYVRAGAEVLETNTFGANPVKLSSYGLEARTEELNRAAAELARDAAGGRAFVVGAMGPLGIRIEPWGPTSRDEAERHFARQVQGLLEGGVDGFVLETFSDVTELLAALAAVRARSELPVVAQMTVGEDGQTSYGTPVEGVAEALEGSGADVLGLNCSVGPAAMLEAMERMAAVCRLPLSAQPNAGLPRTVRDRKIYLASPEYMARYARRLIDAGVRFVGGCCGTTPDHVRRIAEVVQGIQPRHPAVRMGGRRAEGEPPASPVPLADRSALGARLASGGIVTTLEMVPPRGWDASVLVERARRARAAGVDAVSIVDSARVRSRMASIPAAAAVLREAGVEPVVHYTCRDRNMMGMLSDLLGAAGVGLRNLLVVSGDPSVQGPYPDSTVVFDIDSIGLVNLVKGLNHGVDPGGASIGEPTRFVVAVAANPGAVDMEREVRRFMYKVEAGADYAVTQPLFDVGMLERFLESTAAWPLPVVAGLWPLTSLRNAEFLANEVPGVVVPDAVVERMRRAQERGADAAREEGIAIAREVMEAALPMVQGVHVSTPGGDVDAALAVLEGVLEPPALRPPSPAGSPPSGSGAS